MPLTRIILTDSPKVLHEWEGPFPDADRLGVYVYVCDTCSEKATREELQGRANELCPMKIVGEVMDS